MHDCFLGNRTEKFSDRRQLPRPYFRSRRGVHEAANHRTKGGEPAGFNRIRELFANSYPPQRIRAASIVATAATDNDHAAIRPDAQQTGGGSRWENAVNVLEQAFTAPIATGLSLVAIVVGSPMFACGEGRSKHMLGLCSARALFERRQMGRQDFETETTIAHSLCSEKAERSRIGRQWPPRAAFGGRSNSYLRLPRGIAGPMSPSLRRRYAGFGITRAMPMAVRRLDSGSLFRRIS